MLAVEKIEDHAKKKWPLLAEQYKNPVIRFGMTLLEIFPVGLLITLICAALLLAKKSFPKTPDAMPQPYGQWSIEKAGTQGRVCRFSPGFFRGPRFPPFVLRTEPSYFLSPIKKDRNETSHRYWRRVLQI